MNNRKILEAIQEVDEIGTISPSASPPDILGVLAHSIYPVLEWTSFSSIRFIMDKVRDKFALTPRDVDELLAISERTVQGESPAERRARLFDVFAGRVEDEELLAERDPPEEANPALEPEDFPPDIERKADRK